MPGEPFTPQQREAIARACRRHHIVLCYLFGSRTTPFADEASDWDFGVVFDRARVARVDTGLWLDVVPEFEQIVGPEPVDLVLLQQAPPAIRNAAIHGVLLYAESDLTRADFEERVMRVWMDLRPFLDAQDRDTREAIRSGHFVC